MENKIDRTWDSKIKTTEELHEDAKSWLSEIYFIKDEIRFLDHLLGSNYLQLLSSEKSKNEVKKYIFKMNYEKELLDEIIETISTHENELGSLIKSQSVKSNPHFLERHKQLDMLTQQFFKKYKTLKKNIFLAVEEVKRSQKKKKLGKAAN
ncbi:MAG: hypothetical protein HKN90_04625 [Flavobacteriaceae bacterium]|nr:hypothetical protein [Flavobacteriaceae bacterium]